MKTIKIGLTILLIFILLSCSSQKAEWQGTIEEVDGVTVVKNPKEGIWDLKEKSGVAIITGQKIGQLDGPEEYLFVNITDVAVNRKGDIYVADRKLNEVRKFDKDGEYILTVGRPGQGPGEFQYIQTVSVNKRNDLIVFDGGLGRISVFSDSGEHKETTKKLLMDSWIMPSKIFDIDGGYVFFGKLRESNKLFHEFDRDWNLLKSYIDYESINNKEYEELNLATQPGNCYFQNSGNILYTKFYYDNKIFIYKNRELEKTIIRESEIKKPYEVLVFHDINKARDFRNPEYNFKLFGQGIAFVGKTYQCSLGIYPLSDGYIINFLSLKKSKDLWEFGVELYDSEGRFLKYSKLGENLYYDVRCKDSSDLFYAIDRKEYHKVITFRLTY